MKVYQLLMDAAVFVFSLLKQLPVDERYASAAQARRSAPSGAANFAEAWRKRRYKRHFMSKMTDAEAEAAETQVWLELWFRLQYITEEQFNTGYAMYEISIKQMMSLQATHARKSGWK